MTPRRSSPTSSLSQPLASFARRKSAPIAGLAAFFGLGVLALLCFSQARDIRRLREWAGSAPERDAERKESTSEAAAERAEELRRLEEAREAERAAAELRETRRQRREAGLPELTRGERLRGSLGGDGGGRSRLAEPVVLVAIFLVVAADRRRRRLRGAAAAAATTTARAQAGGKAKPAEIEVTVLNGTAVPELAAQFGDKVERKGFELGAVSNSDSSFEESVVMYSSGHAHEAHRVAKALGISKVKPRRRKSRRSPPGLPSR